MPNNPPNPAVRTLIEVDALIGLGAWGWHTFDGGMRCLAAIIVPGVAASSGASSASPVPPAHGRLPPRPDPVGDRVTALLQNAIADQEHRLAFCADPDRPSTRRYGPRTRLQCGRKPSISAQPHALTATAASIMELPFRR
jgi:hypothetical protein